MFMFKITKLKTKDSELNNEKHSLNLIWSWFLLTLKLFNGSLIIFITIVHYMYQQMNLYRQWRKKNAFFSNNRNFLNFQYKRNHVNTKTTCNKCSFDYLH